MKAIVTRSRGRPRDPATRKRILAAASQLLDEGGLSAVTMEAIAARAQVGKPTVYREWPNANAVAMSAFLERARRPAARARSRTALLALKRQLRELSEAFATRAGRSTVMMIAAAQNDSELAKVPPPYTFRSAGPNGACSSALSYPA